MTGIINLIRKVLIRYFPRTAIKYKKLIIDKSLYASDPLIISTLICAMEEFSELKLIPEFSPKGGQIENGKQYLWNGCVTVFPHGNDIVHKIWELTFGAPEPDEILLFLRVARKLPDDLTMIEVGAGNGFYSIIMGKEKPNSKLILIEANPRLYAVTEKNMELNDFRERALVIHAAAAESSGKTVGVYDASYGSYIRSDGGDFQVRSIALDDLIKEKALEKVHLVHIDVQGAEELVLEGMHRILSDKRVDFVFIGTHSVELHNACENTLNGYGYKTVFSKDKTQCIGFDGIIICARPTLV
jgi:FkbM family methyltransferase